MTKQLVIRDAAGAVINIGPWDEQLTDVVTNPLPDTVTGEDEPDEEGVYRRVWRDEDSRDVVHVGDWDFGLTVQPMNAR